MKRLVIPVSFLVLTFLAFGRSLFQGFAPIDDALLIVNNLATHGISLENLKVIFTTFDPELYIPLTLFSFQLNYLIGGLNPFGYHLTNILLHAGNAVLVAWLMRLITGRNIVALAAGILFAIHPLHTEAVVWITGRKDLLSAFFFLLSFIFYLRYRDGKRASCTKLQSKHHQLQHRRNQDKCGVAPSRFSGRAKTYYAISLIFFLLALLGKVMTVTLPVVLLLSDWLIAKRTLNRRFITDKAPYFLIATIFMVIAVFGKERVLAANTSLYETALMACKSTVFYLEKLFVPLNLSIFYPYRGPISLVPLDFAAPIFIVLALFIICALLLKRRPWIVFGFFFFLITLSPTYITFKKAGIMYFASDRYAYIPSIGIIFLLALAISKLRLWLNRFAFLITGILVITILCGLCIRQTGVWESGEVLFHHALSIHPESLLARDALARTYREQGRLEKAFKILQGGQQYGDHMRLRLGAGTIYAKMGQVSDAREQFEKAMELEPENPEPLFYMGSLEEQVGNTKKAQDLFEEAVSMDSSYVAARIHLGRIYFEQGRIDDAFEQFKEAVGWNPNSREGHLEMAKMLEMKGKQEEASHHREKARELDVDF